MSVQASVIFLFASFLASIAGAICGIGGGIIVKPTLELFGWASTATISFLSGIMVLTMSGYSVIKSFATKNSSIELKTSSPLSLGAAAGGVVGKMLFNHIQFYSNNASEVGAAQAVCLIIVTICTMVYNHKKSTVKTLHLLNPFLCSLIGLVLGMMSSFLGIGGGPVNLVVLNYFFSMDTKTAASNSLYVILFSQTTSLLFSVLGNSIPPFEFLTLLCMILGGLGGSIVGNIIRSRVTNSIIDHLILYLMVLIIAMCSYNLFHYLT